jgi:hypothetical protein
MDGMTFYRNFLYAGACILGVAVLSSCSLETTLPSDLIETATQLAFEAQIATAVAGTQIALGEEPAPPPGVVSTTAPPATPTDPARPPTPDLPNSVGPHEFPENINPLTGLAVDDPGVLERRPVAVKINNYPRSNRPQFGLSLADLVFEFYHNNDLPRFHAIFYSRDVPMAGPIRSGRLFDNYLLQMYGSHFAFGSADLRILNVFKSMPYVDRLVYILGAGDCPGTPMCRFDPTGTNLLVTDTQGIRDFNLQTGGDDRRPDLSGMWFSQGLPGGGRTLTRLYIRWSYGAYLYWDYDPASGRYLRYQDTQEDFNGRGEAYALLTDRLNGEAVAADTVVVLVMPHFHRIWVPSDGTNPKVEIVDMEFEGDGRAYALRDGQWFEVYWIRPDGEGAITLVFEDGTLFPYKPGQTWYEVVSTESSLDFEGESARIEWYITPPDRELRDWGAIEPTWTPTPTP